MKNVLFYSHLLKIYHFKLKDIRQLSVKKLKTAGNPNKYNVRYPKVAFRPICMSFTTQKGVVGCRRQK